MSKSTRALLLLLVMSSSVFAACQTSERPEGTTFYVDEEGNIGVGASPVAAENDGTSSPTVPRPAQLVLPSHPPPPPPPGEVTESIEVEQPLPSFEKQTNTTRYVVSLLPDPYTPDANLAPLREWRQEDGICGERLNLFDPNQQESEKIPRIARYDRIECILDCDDGQYLAKLFPVGDTLLTPKNFTLADKTCISSCVGHQAGWSC